MGVTSKQLAELAGVSRGTVDRALNDRGRVNPDTARRIKELAKELGYEPNRYGQALGKSSEHFKIGVILQSAETPTMQIVAEGVDQAKKELNAMGTEVYREEVLQLDSDAVLSCIDHFMGEKVQGLAITPSDSQVINDRIRSLSDQGFPVITMNSDSPDSGRLCFVGMDNYRAGQTAASLMKLMFPHGGKVFPLTGHLNNTAHKMRLAGFTETLQADPSSKMTLLPFHPCLDRDDLAYELVQDVLNSDPDLGGIYVAANGQSGVCDAVRDAGLEKQIRVIAFDSTPDNNRLLEENRIHILLDQEAFLQGYQPPMLLQEYLMSRRKPQQELLYTDIRVCTKYNIEPPIPARFS